MMTFLSLWERVGVRVVIPLPLGEVR